MNEMSGIIGIRKVVISGSVQKSIPDGGGGNPVMIYERDDLRWIGAYRLWRRGVAIPDGRLKKPPTALYSKLRPRINLFFSTGKCCADQTNQADNVPEFHGRVVRFRYRDSFGLPKVVTYDFIIIRNKSAFDRN